MSSPTRARVATLEDVVNEAIITKSAYEGIVKRSQRRQKRYHDTIIRRAIKPSDGRISVSHEDIVKAVQETIREGEKAEYKH